MRAIDGDRLKRKAQKVATEAWKMKTKATVEVILNEFIDWINEAPTIEPQRKKGKWIPVTNGRGGFECDQCHNYAPSYQDGVEWLSGFCPNCGADMREDGEANE